MNEQKKFFISHEGTQIGPFTIDEIVAKVKSSELTIVDFIFEEDKNDWMPLIEHRLLKNQLQKNKPAIPPKPTSKTSVDKNLEANKNQSGKMSAVEVRKLSHAESVSSEWYVLKGENKFGPFAYTEVIKMLQQKLVFEFDFAWKPGMDNWQRIAEIKSFQYDNVKELKGTLMPEIEEVFFRRRHKRCQFGGTILIHDDNKVWKGQGVEISAGGAAVIMENSMIIPGQTLFLHFKPGDGVPPFNAVCEVVSKKYLEGISKKDTPIRYGLKFTEISSEVKERLIDYTSKKPEVA